MSWFAFDVMGLITFGENSGFVKAQEQKMELVHQRGLLALMTPMNDAIWIVRLGFSFFPFLKHMKHLSAAVDFCWETVQMRMKVRIGIPRYCNIMKKKMANVHHHRKTRTMLTLTNS
jgi:hypothetical protein